MARFLLAEGEDLLARFRPHAASLLPRYGLDLLWVAYGAAAALIFERTDASHAGASFVFAAFAFLHALAMRFLKQRGFIEGVAWAIAGCAVGFLAVTDRIASGNVTTAYAPGLGAAAALVGLAASEFTRTRRVHHLTSRRLVLRRGFGHIVERSIDLDRVVELEASQGPLGQVFGYGTLMLRLAPRGRARKGQKEPMEVLRGVPGWEDVKHRLEEAMSELRLSPRERAKRMEERRIKESMRAIAGWTGPGSP